MMYDLLESGQHCPTFSPEYRRIRFSEMAPSLSPPPSPNPLRLALPEQLTAGTVDNLLVYDIRIS
ncbi:hypothetical protein LINGRAHAP2_LOCUS6590, partial [Linum grandiflorum]